MTRSTLCRQILSEPELIARELARMDELEAAWLAGQKVYRNMTDWRVARDAGSFSLEKTRCCSDTLM